jgi:glutamine synthetase
MEPILEKLRRDIVALGLPLRSIEVELGPSQCEFTFHPQIGLSPADTMMLFRSAVKQVCRRQGYHASFMARPKPANLSSSGWHLHQSLRFCRVPDAISSLDSSHMHARPQPSPRRRSTATSVTAATRWRPTGRSGDATIAA